MSAEAEMCKSCLWEGKKSSSRLQDTSCRKSKYYIHVQINNLFEYCFFRQSGQN